MNKVKIETTCPICGKVHFVEVDEDKLDLAEMVIGREIHAQTAFPDMPAPERELLITGIDNECWQKLFGQEEDEDE